MSNNRRGARFWINTWLPVLLAILMIVIESTEWMGADHTSGPLRTIWQAIFGHVSERQWQIIHHYLRKTGHFIGYGFVGLTWLQRLVDDPAQIALLDRHPAGAAGEQALICRLG